MIAEHRPDLEDLYMRGKKTSNRDAVRAQHDGVQQHHESCTTTVSANESSGRITSGMLAFDSTVVRSETGSDFQNRMLRSRRSPCSASRQ